MIILQKLNDYFFLEPKKQKYSKLYNLLAIQFEVSSSSKLSSSGLSPKFLEIRNSRG